MTARTRLPLLVCTLLLLGVVRVHAEVGLNALLSATQSTLEWNASLALGVISNGENTVVFKPGMDWVLLNYNEKIATGPILRGVDGAILFSDPAAQGIEAALARPRDEAPSIVPGSMPPPAEHGARAGKGHPSRIAAIVIDPGHGGIDPGTNHWQVIDGKRTDVVEKEITLKVGLELYRELTAHLRGVRVVLTRHDDSYVSLEQRTEIANSIALKPDEAMIFVSIHANASFDPKASGYEAWYLPPSYDRSVVDPNSLPQTAKALYPILNSMREEEYTIESVLLGKKILSGIQSEVGSSMVDRGLKQQSWFVVRKAKMPAVLVELGFVTNRTEAALLSSDGHLKEMARGLYNGIRDFITFYDGTGGFTE